MPGVYPVVDSSDLVSTLEGGAGILAIVGLGTGVLEPKKLHHVTPNAGILNRLFIPGSEILTAAKLAINPSGQVPGASHLYLVTANPATKASTILQDGSSADAITLTSHGYGLAFNGIEVVVDDVAKEVTLTYGTGAEKVTEIFSYGTGADSLAALVAKINDTSALVVAALIAAGDDTLDTITATAFTGGTDGITGATPASITLKDETPATALDVITLTTKGLGTGQNSMDCTIDDTAKTLKVILGDTEETFTYGTGAGALQALVALINATSGLVTAVFIEGGTETLADLAAAPFTGGAAVSAPTLADWTDCLDQLGGTNVNLVMVATPLQTVQVALADHCEVNKRIGFCGYSLQTGWQVTNTRATNISNLQARATALGSPAVLFSGVGTDDLASYLSVAKYAGIAAGVAPSVPLNNKDLQTSVIEAELSIEEAEDLLAAGVSPPFRRLNPNRPGFVIADGLSTYTADDNLYNRIISVRRAADGMNQDIIYELENYLGSEATEVMIGRVISAVDRRLSRAMLASSSLRIANYDRNAISATFESTVLKVYYSFEPIQPIRFIVPIASLKATVIEQTIEIPLGQ